MKTPEDITITPTKPTIDNPLPREEQQILPNDETTPEEPKAQTDCEPEQTTMTPEQNKEQAPRRSTRQRGPPRRLAYNQNGTMIEI